MARIKVWTKTGKSFSVDLEKIGDNPAHVDGEFTTKWRSFFFREGALNASFPVIRGGYVAIPTSSIDFITVED